MSRANIIIEVYCLLITVILQVCNVITTMNKPKSKRTSVLCLMLFMQAVIIISFIISVLNEGNASAAVWNNIVTGICYAGGAALTELFGEYVLSIVEEKQKTNNKYTYIFRAVCCTVIALDLISIFNGMYFSTVDGFHVRGPYYMFNQAAVLVIMLAEFIYILSNIKAIGRQASALAMYGLIPAVAVVLQIYISDYNLMYPAVTLSMLVIYIVSYIHTSNDLNRKNEELTKAIQEAEHAKALMEKANRSKSEFLSSMSHDIRTPLNAIVGMTDIAIENIDDRKTALENLNVVKDSSKHLLYLVNDVLDLSMIESGKIQIAEAEFFLPDMFTEIESLVWPLTKAKQQSFTLDSEDNVDDCFIGDSTRIKQVLMNLLSNAIKYTQVGGTIVLKVNEEKSADGKTAVLNFSCIDNGIGIDKKAQEHIFEPFEREIKSTINPVEGTGLGLTISHNIVEAMHGTISVQSEKGIGSTFNVSLPIRCGDEEKMMRQFDNVRKYHALVIADTQELCEYIKDNYPEIIGVPCDVAKSEEILKGNLEPKNYDVIICISVEKAVDVTYKLRETYPKTYIIFGCNMDMMCQEKQILNAGADSVLYRPVFKSTLFEEYQRLNQLKNPISIEKKYLLGKNILVAEDHSINYMIAEHMLQTAGAIVWRAEDGMKAVDMYMGSKAGQYDAILMDIMMPVMDGYTAAQKIRNSSRADSHSIPIIAMTANAFAEDIQKSKDYGMNAHLSKPLDADKMKETLLHCFNQAENN